MYKMAMPGESKKKRTERATGAQIQALVDGVVEDTTLHTEKFTGPTGSGPGKVKLREKWEALARRLNQLGPTKHWTQWKQTWRDLKNKARKRNIEVTRSERAIGNKSYVAPLTDLEKKVLMVVGTGPTEGRPRVEEMGLSQPQQQNQNQQGEAYAGCYPFYSYQGMEAFPGPSGHVPATQNPVEETAPDPEPPGLTRRKIPRRRGYPPTVRRTTMSEFRAIMAETNSSLRTVADGLQTGLEAVAIAIREGLREGFAELASATRARNRGDHEEGGPM